MSLKKALHASIRRVPSFISAPYETKTGKKIKITELFFLIPGLIKFFKLCALKERNAKFKYELGIMAIVKNEALYIDEWINYYQSIGVDHIYIYDNESTDNLQQVLEKHGTKVTYCKFNGKARQMDAYNDALNRFGNDCHYLGFLDADEFVYVKEKGGHTRTLKELLDTHFSNPNVGGLVINWQLFGSSGYEKAPTGLVTNNFVYRAERNFERNRHVKSIVNPRKTAGFINDPHAPYYLPKYWAVNEKSQRVDGPFTETVNVNLVQINHYFTKSKAEFILKKNRGQATSEPQRTFKDFEEHDKNDVFDECLRVYNDEHDIS